MRILFLGKAESPLVQFMQSQGDEVVTTEDKIGLSQWSQLNPEFTVSFGYKHIIQKNIIELFSRKIINLHISYLPWNKGADPNFWSFVEGTSKGVTIHYIDEGLDTGDILAQRKFIFEKNETLKTSYEKLQLMIIQLFKEKWSDIKNGRCPSFKQIGSGSSHKVKDKIPLEYLLKEKGFDTPVASLEQLFKSKNP